MENKNLKLEYPVEGILVILINRPAALNALNLETLTELNITIRESANNPSVRAVILTGCGEKAFIAGADIIEMQKMSRAESATFSQIGHKVARGLEELSKPTIAAVNGFAFGGGLEMALACDFIYASSKAVFGQPEVGLGVIPGFGGTFRLAKHLGWPAAKEMIFSGRRVSAEEALKMGLVVDVLPQENFMSAVINKTQEIVKHSPRAISSAKKLMNLLSESSGMNFKMDAEAQAFAGLFGEPDQVEGMNAFVGKRKPTFF